MTAAEPRERSRRRRDSERTLRTENDLWVATSSADGVPHLIPLSHHWDGQTVLLATAAASPTGRNLERTGTARLAIGATRDVTTIEGTVHSLPMSALDEARGDAFALHTGFDPRALTTRYDWYLVTPRRVQAWREENELTDRELMRDGVWLVAREEEDES